MTYDKIQLRRAVLLHLVDGLLDNIGPHVRGVRARWNEQEIMIDAVVTDGFDEVEHEGLELMLTHMFAAFSPDYRIGMEIHVINPPTRPSLPGDGEWVYRRQEPEPPDEGTPPEESPYR